jgi:phosphinothricin acetyltransferase
VEHSTATFALTGETEADRLSWLKEHQQSGLPVIVLEDEGAILGFASLSFYHQRCAYKQTVEASIYLDAGAVGRGFGASLLDELMALAKNCGFHAVLALICSENIASVKLIERSGFVQAGLLREVGRKFDRFLDVAIWEKLL